MSEARYFVEGKGLLSSEFGRLKVYLAAPSSWPLVGPLWLKHEMAKKQEEKLPGTVEVTQRPEGRKEKWGGLYLTSCSHRQTPRLWLLDIFSYFGYNISRHFDGKHPIIPISFFVNDPPNTCYAWSQFVL